MAGTVEEERVNGHLMTTIKLTCVADVGDGSFPNTEITALREWFLYSMETVTPGTAPTANYDIELQSSHGTDLLGGNGADRAAAGNEIAYPVTAPTMVDGTLTQVISNNSVNSATITIIYQFVR